MSTCLPVIMMHNGSLKYVCTSVRALSIVKSWEPVWIPFLFLKSDFAGDTFGAFRYQAFDLILLAKGTARHSL